MAAPRKRRQRVDSTAGAVEVMAKAAAAPLAPPSTIPLSGAALVFFGNILDEAAKSEWTAHKVELAAILARSMADVILEQDALAALPPGTPPDMRLKQHNAIDKAHSRITAMRRSLGIHARAVGGDARDIGKRRAMAKEIENGAPDDDLLARPN